MERKTISAIMLTLLLTNMLTVAFNVPSIVADSSSTVQEADGNNPLNLTDSQEGFLSEGFNQNASAKEDPRPCSVDEDKWNFNKINEWADFAVVDGSSAELVIGVNNGEPNSYADITGLIGENGGELVGTVSMGDGVRAVVADIPLAGVSSFVTEVRTAGLSSYIEPNIKFQANFVPNDPYWSQQWGPRIIGADYAWNTTLGDHTVLVAVVDTGIDWDHPDLAANYVALGYDWVNDDTDPMDDEGHGTHCAGIIAATIDNSIGVAGLAQIQIMAEKSLDQYGGGYADDLADAIVHAVGQGADILSLSWGSYYPSELIHDALIYAHDHGVLAVAAAGNDATSMKLYPAGYDEVVAVTATDEYDNPAWFTNFGDWVELAAPGVDIYSTIWNDDYAYKSGTSMSTPHISGVASLILSQFPNMTRDQVRVQLRSTADDLGGPGFDDYYGYGRVNARRAVEQAPPDHDLLILDWEGPRFVEPGALATVNTTVFNFGTYNETNITVQLLVNGSVVDFATIDFLETGMSETVGCTWTPMVEGTYNLTSHVLPVPGETLTTNNVVTATVRVGYFKYVLFDQTHGTDSIVMYGTWVTALTERGYVIDVHTYGSINSTVLVGYDAFVIPQAQDFYASEELSAIQNFVIAGGGLLVIGDDNPSIYTDLTSFAGITWAPDGYGGYTSDITPHPVTEGVTTAYFDSPVSSLYVTDPAQDLIRDSYGYIMLAASEIGVLGIADEHSINDYYISYADNLQLANNMIDWLVIQYEHDLAVTLDAPTFLNPGDSSLLNATVLNRGLSNETDVELFLLINGTIVNNVTIPELVNDAFHTINYLWTPTVEGIYNVTSYVVPVPGENITANNVDSAFVAVGFAVKAFVLDSWGTDFYTTTWEILNINWYTYGNTIICIDYTTLNIDDISYSDIAATDADVLIISCAYDWEFTDSEIDAITQYVLEGHGLIATAGTLYYMVPNNNKLAPLFGLSETVIWDATGTDLLNILDPAHPLFVNIPDPYILYKTTSVPSDYAWDSNELMGGTYVALGDYLESAIVAYNGLVFISPWVEYMPTNDDLQLLYNAITWSRYTIPEHELTVSLEAPEFLEPGDSTFLNATVYNRGLNNETDVELFLLINGTEVNYVTIPELVNGTSYTIDYLWTPTVEGIYNVTSYVVPVLGENITANNVKSVIVLVQVLPDILIVNDDDGSSWIIGTSLQEFELTLTAAGYDYWVWNESSMSSPPLDFLTKFELVIWTCGDYWNWAVDPVDAVTLESYLAHGGNILLEGEDIGYNHDADSFMVNVAHATYQVDDTGAPGLTVTDPIHPVTFDLPTSFTWLTNPPYDDGVSPTNGGAEVIQYTGTTWTAVTVFEGASNGSVVYYAFPLCYLAESHRETLAINSINWLLGIQYEHELAVALEAPDFLQPSYSSLLNATVYNRGLNNETGVELFLLINGTEVESVVIPELLTGSSYTLSYLWTPPIEGIYNLTAYAPPVVGENVTANNMLSVFINVQYLEVALFKNVDPWNYPANEEALSLYGIVYAVFSSNDFGLVDLSSFSKVVIASDQDQAFYNAMDAYIWWFEDYVSSGGVLEIHAADLGWQGGQWVGTLPGGLGWVHSSSDYVTIVDPPHPVVTTPNPITDAELDGWSASVHGYFSTYPACSHIVIVEDSTGYPAYLEFDYGSGFIVASSQTLEWAYKRGDSLILENSLLYSPIKYPHELAVTLDASTFLEPGDSSLLNATVYNRGLNNEIDVELFLLINGTEVNYVTIPELVNGTSYTIDYLWTPTIEGIYNLTAYAPPVPGENFTANNWYTKFARVQRAPGFQPGTGETTKIWLMDATNPTAAPVTYPDGQQYIELNDTYTVGDTFTVWANVTNVTELNLYQVGVTYDNATLICTSYSEGEFFYRADEQYRTNPINHPILADGSGFLGWWNHVTWVLAKPGHVSGNGTLAVFEFEVVGYGVTLIDIILTSAQVAILGDVARTPLDFNTIDIVFDNTGTRAQRVVGGKAAPINLPINKSELQIPWMWLTTIILQLVLAVLYVKKRKRDTEIISQINNQRIS